MRRDQMIDRTRVTQPMRTDIPPPGSTTEFCHVYAVGDRTGHLLSVRRFRPLADDGAYEYVGGVTEARCWPGYLAFEYETFVFDAEAWSSDGATMLLVQVGGRSYVDPRPPLMLLGDEVMEIAGRHFPVVDAVPVIT